MPFPNPTELVTTLEYTINHLPTRLRVRDETKKGEKQSNSTDLARKNEVAFLSYVLDETKKSSKTALQKAKILLGAMDVIKQSIWDEYRVKTLSSNSMCYTIVNEHLKNLDPSDLSECARELNSLLKNVYKNGDSRFNELNKLPESLSVESLRKYMQIAVKHETTYSAQGMVNLKTADDESSVTYTTNLRSPLKFHITTWAQLVKEYDSQVQDKELGTMKGTIEKLPHPRNLQLGLLDELKKSLAKLAIIEKNSRTDRPKIQIFLGAMYLICQNISKEYKLRDVTHSKTYNYLQKFLRVEDTSVEEREHLVSYTLDYLRAMTFQTGKDGVTVFRKNPLFKDIKFICDLINDGQQIIEECRLEELNRVIPEVKKEGKSLMGGIAYFFKKPESAAAETDCSVEKQLSEEQGELLNDALSDATVSEDDGSSEEYTPVHSTRNGRR